MNLKLRIVILAICLAISFIRPAGSAFAAELVMLVQDGCSWCARWNAEIGPIYPKTDEAKLAPLRVVDIDDPWPDNLSNIPSDHFTPTFILVDDGVEIERIRGYSGDEFFWFLLGEMLEKLGDPKGS